MKINTKTKYEIHSTKKFDKDLKKLVKQGKKLDKLEKVVIALANGEKLEDKYRNHKLIDNRRYIDCYECHIEPNWLLVYQYENNKLVLVLFATGSHSELFD